MSAPMTDDDTRKNNFQFVEPKSTTATATATSTSATTNVPLFTSSTDVKVKEKKKKKKSKQASSSDSESDSDSSSKKKRANESIKSVNMIRLHHLIVIAIMTVKNLNRHQRKIKTKPPLLKKTIMQKLLF